MHLGLLKTKLFAVLCGTVRDVLSPKPTFASMCTALWTFCVGAVRGVRRACEELALVQWGSQEVLDELSYGSPCGCFMQIYAFRSGRISLPSTYARCLQADVTWSTTFCTYGVFAGGKACESACEKGAGTLGHGDVLADPF